MNFHVKFMVSSSKNEGVIAVGTKEDIYILNLCLQVILQFNSV